ncbi:hypothetical protein FQN55_001667 [Onygenales sp. PD_40]|nr:hypothetical protein FQN55_001667 [Onygenales sp. PD_40]
MASLLPSEPPSRIAKTAPTALAIGFCVRNMAVSGYSSITALSGDESAALPPNPGVHSTLADTARRSNEAFEFITSKDEASRRKARSHVMRDFMRRKRSRSGRSPLDQGEIGSAPPSSNMTDMQFKWKSASRKRGASSRNVRFMASKGHASAQGEESAVDSPADPPIRPLSQPGFQQTSRGSGQQTQNVAEFPGLRGRHAASHFNPFPSHMWKVDFDDHRVMHHYVFSQPCSILHLVAVQTVTPSKLILRLAPNPGNIFTHQIPNVVGSRHLSLDHSSLDPTHSFAHKANALGILRDVLRRGQYNDSTIPSLLLVAGLIFVEDRCGHRHAVDMHRNGLIHLVKAYGGMSAISQHRIIERLVYWVDYTTSPNPSIPCSLPWLAYPYLDINISYAEIFMTKTSQTLPSGNPQSIQANTNTSTSTRVDTPRPDLLRYILSTCDEFLCFMQHMCWLTLQTSIQSKSLNPPAAILHRAATFKIGSPLHSLLSSPGSTTTTPTSTNISNSAITESQNITTDYARMSSLLYLNLALWDFRNDPTGLSRFLTYLSSQLQTPEQQQQPLDPSQIQHHGTILAPESLLWICLLADNLQFGTNEVQCSQRLWFTGRLLRTVKRVDKVVFRHIQELLVGFLALDVPVDGNRMLVWEVEKVRESILGELYVRA